MMEWNIPQQYLDQTKKIDELRGELEIMTESRDNWKKCAYALTEDYKKSGEPWCYETGEQAVNGSCPEHNGDACLRTPEGLVEMIQQYKKLCDFMGTSLSEVYDIPDPYDPTFGDERVCTCGHSYYRHFDTYEDMRAVGCKYCSCYEFEDNGDRDPGPPESL